MSDSLGFLKKESSGYPYQEFFREKIPWHFFSENPKIKFFFEEKNFILGFSEKNEVFFLKKKTLYSDFWKKSGDKFCQNLSPLFFKNHYIKFFLQKKNFI